MFFTALFSGDKMKTLYISDLDGTLLDNSAEITPASKKLLNEFISKGNYFSVATARTGATVILMLDGVEINVPIVLMNGVATYDVKEKKYVNIHSFSHKAKEQFLNEVCLQGSPGFLYCIDGDELSTFYENTKSPNAQIFINEREKKFGKKFIKVSSYRECVNNSVVYYSYSDKYEKLKPLYDKAKEIDGIRCEFYRDTYNTDFWYFEVCSDKASKYNAVQFLKEKYGFEKVVAFGDNLNDLPLFEAADESYAVENAKEDVKKHATAVIGRNTDDSVAKFLISRTVDKL